MTANDGLLNQCDIIMKGGITSGVVYPKAILRLSEKYRFRSIGGTSAGAIAAVITAAAELNRSGGGFKVIERLPGEIEKILESLFQPTPSVRTVFDAAKLVISDKPWRKTRAAFKFASGYLLHFFAVFVPFMALGWYAFSVGNRLAGWLSVVLAVMFGILVVVGAAIVGTLTRLRKLDFGFCPGRTQVDSGPPGLSDWLADKIEIAAGRMQEGGARPATPLTFGDIRGDSKNPAIDLRMMTTNLSVGRPHTLPDMDKNHYFKEGEFRRIFPDWIVDYLVCVSKSFPGGETVPAGCLRFPVGDAMPLIVAARMSLSFPILFSAVPLYRKDFSMGSGSDAPIARMLFSDGGISSNFPVHFFDAMLPTRPTFGISLEEWDERLPDRRITLAVEPETGMWLDGHEIATYGGFFGSILSAAKDWQDRLQSTLPGYRERIADIYLDAKKEGGLNLTMTEETINSLIGFGDRAGGLMTGAPQSDMDHAPFDFDEHRWRRFLIAFARFEESLQTAAKVWTGRSETHLDDDETIDKTYATFSEFIDNYKEAPKHYHSSTPQWRLNVFKRFDALMQMAATWPTALRLENNGHNIPRPDSSMRITPKP